MAKCLPQLNFQQNGMKQRIFIFAQLQISKSYVGKILQTDVVNIRGDVSNPTIEFLYPVELAKDTVLIELEGIVVEEDCEYLIQIESYGKRVYAQEQLSSLLSLGLESYVEKTFSSKQPGQCKAS